MNMCARAQLGSKGLNVLKDYLAVILLPLYCWTITFTILVSFSIRPIKVVMNIFARTVIVQFFFTMNEYTTYSNFSIYIFIEEIGLVL
jgi:type IV secretory pathway TrbL component